MIQKPGRISLVFSLLFLTTGASAQDATREAEIAKTGLAYLHFGPGAGYPHALTIGADFVAGRSQFTIGYAGLSKKSPGLPRNAPELTTYGYLDVNLFRYPQQTFSGLKIGYGYIWYLGGGAIPRHRFVMRGSALIGQRRDLIGGRNYLHGLSGYEYEKHRAFGVMLEPRMEFIAARGFGGGIGPYVVITDHIVGGGVSLSMLVGYVSNYRRPVNKADREATIQRRLHPFRRFR